MISPPLTNLENELEPETTQTKIYGSTEPSLWTPPLLELTPDTSYGYDVIDFARTILKSPLDPWQSWMVIHLGELLPDGTPRFKQALILVARQNGKTHLLRVLTAYWMFIEEVPRVLGTSTNRDMAKQTWEQTIELVEASSVLNHMVDPSSIRRANGQEYFSVPHSSGTKSTYKIAASNRRGGRGDTVDRLIMDELREHQTWEAWNASYPATSVPPSSQIIAISNQGDDTSVVLNSLRDAALKDIQEGTSHLSRHGLFEYSAPEGSDILDPEVWAMANPNLGYRIPLDAIAGPAKRAFESGGIEEAGFKTEILCIPVRALDAAVDPKRWASCFSAGSLQASPRETAWGFDVSLSTSHATLVAAGLEEEDIRVQEIASWSVDDLNNPMTNVMADLVRLLKTYKPKSLVWIPGGPAATYGAELKKKVLVPGVQVSELSTAVTDACMGFSADVLGGRVRHGNQILLNDHVLSAQKDWKTDRWTFSRKGKGSSDAAYAAALAHHAIKTLPPRPSFKFIGPEDDEGEES